MAIFLQETEARGITPVQHVALQAAANGPGIDQRGLARTIGFDTSTIAGRDRPGRGTRPAAARRLAEDRRLRLLTLTPARGLRRLLRHWLASWRRLIHLAVPLLALALSTSSHAAGQRRSFAPATSSAPRRRCSRSRC